MLGLFASVLAQGQSPVISEVSVLLPCRAHGEAAAVTFPLRASGGCFSWELADDDLDNGLELIRERSVKGCVSSIVLVSQRLCSEGRHSFGVIALEQRSGTELLSDVVVDQINALEIDSRNRQLNVGSRQVLFVEATDVYGNKFSSLTG